MPPMFPFASLGKCNAVEDYDGGGGGLGCRDDGMLALPSAPPKCLPGQLLNVRPGLLELMLISQSICILPKSY